MPVPFWLRRLCSSNNSLGLLLALFVVASPLEAAPTTFPPSPSLFFPVGNHQQIPEHIVTAISQDETGYLWIGTANGLVRYDGYRFLRFAHQAEQPNSIAGNFIQSLLLRQNGELWLTAVPGGISHYDPANMAFWRFDNFPAEQAAFWRSAQTLAEDQQQQLWVGSRNGLARIDTEGHGEILPQPALANLNIRALLVDAKNRLWIGHHQGLLLLDLNQPATQPRIFAELSGESVLSLAAADDGSIWIGTATAGVYWQQTDESELQPFPAAADPTTLFTPVHDMLLPSADEIWLARLGGVERWHRESEQLLHRFTPDPSDRYSLAHADVRVLYQDNNALLWLGSYGGGLQRFQASEQVSMLRYSLKHQGGIANPDITSILELNNGDIWLGSRGSGIDILRPGKGIIHRLQPGIAANQLQQGWVTAMTQQADGMVWLATYPNGIYQADPESMQLQRLDLARELNEAVRRFFIDSQHQLWLGTQQGLYRWQQHSAELIAYPLRSPLPQSDYINAFAEDSTGQLWLGGGSSGLYRIRPEQHDAVLVRFSNTASATFSILGLLASQDKLWLDTPEGLYYLDELTAEQPTLHRATEHQPEQQPLGANLLQDGHGRIWSQQRLYDPARQQVFTLPEADGFLVGTPWFRAYHQTAAGLMLFGSAEGLLVVDPDAYQLAQHFAPLAIASLQIDGQPAAIPSQQLQLQPGNRGFSLEFTALDFLQPDKVRYRYQLEGFDSDWIEVDASQRQLSYTNLWPGHYQLRLQSSKPQGDWSPDMLELEVLVAPKFWQQWWFALLCLSALTGLLTALYLWRMRAEKRKARLLRHQVARQQQELQATQKILIEKEKMASLGQVVAGVAHELNTPLGIGMTSSTVLLNEAQQIELLYQQKKITNQRMQQFLQHCFEHLQLLIKNLERSADLVHQFKQVAVDQTSCQLQLIQLPGWLDERLQPYRLGYPALQIELSCPVTALQVRAQALEQIVFQLLQNCCLHAFTESSNKRVAVELTVADNECRLQVRDHGQGIPVELQERLFEPFVTSKRGSQCHGLGLHLSYNLATQVLNGSIKLEHSGPAGSSFLLRFPLQDANAPEKDKTE